MNPAHVAARFTAFVCYLNGDTEHLRSPDEAAEFARENWESFLPYVDSNLGRFLTAPREVVRPGRHITTI
jgi:hypothetical protein